MPNFIKLQYRHITIFIGDKYFFIVDIAKHKFIITNNVNYKRNNFL